MLVQFSGQASTFGAVDPGLCFAFEREGKAHIGLKVRDDAGGGDSCAVVWAEGNKPTMKIVSRSAIWSWIGDATKCHEPARK